ncbi:MAG: arylsulfatase [Verrucomicrobiales bacterium]|nr:arylsulfatase [Verrucomicrobiales bacterium]
MKKPHFYVLLGLLLFACVSTTSAANKPTNIIFIMADDLGYAELGSYGQKKIRTPHLDQLAKEGMRFTRHYSGNAVCAPSRCVLLTGKHPGHAWVRSNKATPPLGQEPIPASEVTVAELLQKKGYATGAFGKWGLGRPGSSGDPLTQGFDRFFGYNCQSRAHSYYSDYLQDDDKHFALKNHPPIPGHASLAEGADALDPKSYAMFKGSDYASDHINAEALKFLDKNKDKPFFLYYPTMIPHVALHVPDEELEPYLKLGWKEKPFTKRKSDGQGHGYTPHLTPKAAYAAMISRMDRYVGKLLARLQELGLAENTLVVFTSDNGTTHLGDEVDFDFFKSVAGLRGLKGSLYEGGVRVPLIVRWPGHVLPGSVSDYVSGFEDWLPTLMEVVGASSDVPDGLDGVSLVPVLEGEKQVERDFLYREFPSYGGQQALWVGKWKAVKQEMLKKGKGQIELYDLSVDEGEQNDVAAKYPEVLQRMQKLMDEQHVPSEVFPLPPYEQRKRKKK